MSQLIAYGSRKMILNENEQCNYCNIKEKEETYEWVVTTKENFRNLCVYMPIS